MGSKTPPRRRRMTFEARREQLLDVTTRLVVQRSFHDISVEAVAREAGITRGVIYQHFGDLRTLLEAVVEREMARAYAQVSETTLTDLRAGDPLELLLESLGAFLGAVRDHPTTWRLVLMPPEGAPETLRTRIARGRSTVRAGMTAAVAPALEAEGEAGDPELTANVLSAISDEYARLVLTDPVRYAPDRLLRHARWWLRRQWP